MSQFLFDKAFMALKAQRYDEATSVYEKILESAYTVDAWTGYTLSNNKRQNY